MADRVSGFEAFFQPLLDSAGKAYLTMEEIKQSRAKLKQEQEKIEELKITTRENIKNARFDNFMKMWNASMDQYNKQHPVVKPETPMTPLQLQQIKTGEATEENIREKTKVIRESGKAAIDKIYPKPGELETPTGRMMAANIRDAFDAAKVNGDWKSFDYFNYALQSPSPDLQTYKETTAAGGEVTKQATDVTALKNFWDQLNFKSQALRSEPYTPTEQPTESADDVKNLLLQGKIDEAGAVAERIGMTQEVFDNLAKEAIGSLGTER